MRIPKRKSEQNIQHNTDAYLTDDKVAELKKDLDKMINVVRPQLTHEVAELAKLGDFSENAAYQMAKGRLRSLNYKILKIQDLLNRAIIIKKGQSADKVQIGSLVTIKCDKNTTEYEILGSMETNPSLGKISHLSPLGAALMGRKKNDEIALNINGRQIKYKIIKIE